MNGNGPSLPSFAQMNSAQRSASMDATVQRVAKLSAHHNAMAHRIAELDAENEVLRSEIVNLRADYDGHIAWHDKQLPSRASLLVDAIATLKSVDEAHGAWHLRLTSSIMARLRWMVLGR